MSSKPPEKVNRFMTHLLRHQDRLYHYIRSLEPRSQDADDVLQETYLILWEKFDEYCEGTSFHAWSCKIAYYKILQRRSQNKRGPIFFSQDVLQQLADDAVNQADELESQRELLMECLDQLPPSDLELIVYRYARAHTCEKIAQLLGRTANSISKSLSTIRRALQKCVHEKFETPDAERRVR